MNETAKKDAKYLTKVAIDFGSTNTVMAWRVYEIGENGERIVSPLLNQTNSVKHIPTLLIFQEDNPGNEAVKRDCCGAEAEAIIRDSNLPPVVRDNFKQKLYAAPAGSPEYNEGKKLTGQFFAFLRAIYRNEVYNRFPGYVAQDMETVLYLSTPVRADPTHRTLMRELAREAGFTPENGISEINTDYDEAVCVVRYAMENGGDGLQEVLGQTFRPEGANALYIDVGGSTMDMALMKLRSAAGGVTADPVAWWPDADVTYPLGGCLIDEAIRDYLIHNGFADREYTMEKWDHGDGKFRFRMFKEENNQRLSEGQTIEKLGRVGSVCYDVDEEILPSQFYNKSNRRIDGSVFENEICREYIEKMKEAVAQIFDSQRLVEGQKAIRPEEIDAIFLTGAGSNLYFIRKILLGDELRFARIKADPGRLFAQWEDPSQCCALGALTEDQNLRMPGYARDEYYVAAELYLLDKNIESYLESHPNALRPGVKELYPDPDDSEKKVMVYPLSSDTIQVTERYAPLPATASRKLSITYIDNEFDYDHMLLKMQLFRLKDNGERINLGAPYIRNESRKLGGLIKSVAKTLPAFVALPFTVLPDLVVEAVTGKDPNLTEKMGEATKKLFQDKPRTLEMAISTKLSENNRFTASAVLTGKNFEMAEQKFEMEL